MKKIAIILLVIILMFSCTTSEKEEQAVIVLSCTDCHSNPPGPHQEIGCIVCHEPTENVIMHYNTEITIETSFLKCMQCHEIYIPTNEV